jgi:hypothetical protein
MQRDMVMKKNVAARIPQHAFSFSPQDKFRTFEMLKLGGSRLMRVVLCFARDYNLRATSSQEFTNDR